MRADYTINIPIDVTELYMLLEDEEFSWIFTTNEEQDVRIRVNIQATGVERGGKE